VSSRGVREQPAGHPAARPAGPRPDASTTLCHGVGSAPHAGGDMAEPHHQPVPWADRQAGPQISARVAMAPRGRFNSTGVPHRPPARLPLAIRRPRRTRPPGARLPSRSRPTPRRTGTRGTWAYLAPSATR
jgi:hypothetical protein